MFSPMNYFASVVTFFQLMILNYFMPIQCLFLQLYLCLNKKNFDIIAKSEMFLKML